MSNETTYHPAEILYVFTGWLTTLEEPVTMGAVHDVAQAAELVKKFMETNDIDCPLDPVSGSQLKHPPGGVSL